MEITVRRNDLVRELALVQGIVERKSSIPILSNALIEAGGAKLNIAATDLDVSLRCGTAAEVRKEGAITLAAKKLFEIARSLPDGEVKISVGSDAWATIESDRILFKMAGLAREDFPALPEATPRGGTEIPAAALRELIARTAFAITAEDARYYLAGALLLLEKDAVTMVTTDGNRLCYARKKEDLQVDAPQRVLVPRKAINELGRLLEEEETVTFQQADNHLVFSTATRTLASKLIEAQFPAFEKVIAATSDKGARVGREAFAGALRRVSLLSSERSRAVRLSLSAGRLELTASSPEVGEARESIPAEFQGKGIEIGFNAQYLLDFLGAASGEDVMVGVKDAESQGVFRPAGDGEYDHRYVVMPMRF